MTEQLFVLESASKEEKYSSLMPQLRSLIEDESDLIANLANVTAVLKTTFDFLWIGFYINKNDELVLGPFQGPLACTRIEIGKGVCGTVAQKQETLVVPDVDQFPGHIVCSEDSKSEIVVPLVVDGRTEMVLDVDGTELNGFDEVDQRYLEELVEMIKGNHY